jgi:hypothetical protein
MRTISISFCVFVVLLSVNIAQATIIHVPTQQTTIQAGINASVNGDTVLVAPGTYYEHISFYGKAILLKSQAGAETTIIARSVDDSAIVTFIQGEDTSTTIDGFKITGANTGGTNNGALLCNSASPTIRNNIFTQNASYRVIRFIDSQAQFTNNVLIDNPTWGAQLVFSVQEITQAV